MAVDIDSLQIEIEATSSDAASKIEQLATALTNLKSAAKGGAGLTTTTKQLQALSNAAKLINGTNLDSQKIQQFASAMNSLSAIQKASGLNSTINALKKLPEISTTINKADLGKFAQQMNQVASAMRPLSTEMQKVSNGFSAFPIRIQKIIQSNTGLTASNNKTAKSFGVLGTGISSTQAKFGVYLIALRQIASVMSNWVKESNDYVENLNLFTVAMGEYAEESKAYAEEVQAAMGIDPSEWMRNQGVFMQMASGFGVVTDKAALMSKNLTQLGYDISSFYNISIEESMQKLQSGLAGEIEPLRRLGYAIDVASLEQVALNHGITESVNAMTQAEKAQLRYVAIMEQSTNAMGDMARTIQTPANAMRILNQQITQLSRALGNLLIPLLQQVIPWVQAFVEVITEAIQALAVLLGFELPTIDYSGLDGVSAGASEAEDAIGGATNAAKEMKRELLGIDELNILEPNKSGGGGAGTGGVSGGDLGLELPEYDFLAGLDEKTSKIKSFLKDISDEVLAISAGLAAWKIAPSVLNWFKDLKNGRFNKIDKIAVGIGLMVTGFTLSWQGAYGLGYNGFSLGDLLKTLIGNALGIAGSLLVFGTGPLGWTVGIGTSLLIDIIAFTVGYNKRKLEKELSERFGEIELTVEEAKELAERMMSSLLSIQLDAYVMAKTTARDAIESYLESAEEFSNLVWRASVGFEVGFEDINESIDSMIADAQSILDAQREVYTLTVGISFSDSEIQSDMALFVEEYFNTSEASLQKLGEELKQTMLDAMADGIIDEQEMKTIQDLQSEVNQMMAAVASAEYRAQLNNAVFDLNGDLSFDSVKAVAEELQTIAQNQLDALEETHLDALALIELKYQTDGNYEEYVAALENEMQTYFSNQADINGKAFQPLIDKLNTAFSDVLAESEEEFARPVTDLLSDVFKNFDTDETGILVGGSISDFMRSVEEQWRSGIQSLNIDKTTEAAIREAIEALKPTAQQLQDIARSCREAGVAVPESIAEGLSDYYQLSAIEGNLDSIHYMLGEKLSTDPNFIEALQTAKDAGQEINAAVAEGLLNNIEIVNNANGTISILNDTIGEKVLEITPELKGLFETLGIDITGSLKESATTGVESAADALDSTLSTELGDLESTAYNSGSEIGKQISNGVVAGIKKGQRNIESAGKITINSAISSMKAQAVIKSPSHLFRDEVGLNIGLGVAEGIDLSARNVSAASLNLIDSAMKASSPEDYTLASEYYVMFATPNVRESLLSGDDYKVKSDYDTNNANTEIVNAILAATQRIVTAIEENGGDIYVEADGTATQNRRNRMYGKTLQKI